jgi:hypothetical protein
MSKEGKNNLTPQAPHLNFAGNVVAVPLPSVKITKSSVGVNYEVKCYAESVEQARVEAEKQVALLEKKYGKMSKKR